MTDTPTTGHRMSRRLTPVPDPILRDGVYVRVSAIMGREDERFLSPAIQREAVDRARARGPESTVVEQWDDIDVSTAKVQAANRPGLQAALTAARAHRIDRLWVLTLDRFDRDTAALKVFDEITALGIELWTEAGRIDIDTPEGYLSTTMQLAIARYQRDRIGKAWKQTQLHRVERGLSHSGTPRWGYTYDTSLSMHIPDPKTAPIVADLYRRYIDGETTYRMVRWLNDNGHRTVNGNRWSDGTLRRFLDAGFAAGNVPLNGQIYRGAHEPLIDRDMWEKFQAARNLRRKRVNYERSQYLLSGMVRCQCGSPMTAGKYGKRNEPKYRCKSAAETGIHNGGYVMADYVERAVIAWLQELADDLEDAVDLSLAAATKNHTLTADADTIRREIARLDTQLMRLTRGLASGLIPEAAYAATRDDLAADRDLAEQQLEQITARASAARTIRPQAEAAALLEHWPVTPLEQRREGLRRLLGYVEVTQATPKSVLRIYPAWE